MAITADEARTIAFPDSGFGRRGYAKHEVDALIDRVVATLSDEDDLTAAEVHHSQFARPPIGKRGYDEKSVDEFLDRVEDTLLARTGVTGGAHHVPTARTESPAVTDVPTADIPVVNLPAADSTPGRSRDG
ncbi:MULTISPECIES: DivIVA domain-containing protein [Prauserella salsuginis group]|uniref:DivIVA domain-containing protein n=2 Tax=Prauserella salsuginis group TaxID=2893672 RepID=A0A839XM18_9PSEU|nr:MULTISPECIES: DivIVA domain-containing protein [Prauserella salsuginis group]MBB3663677.1 DivIVA domain-containing protein [Prauserella sediminis]MCR3722542.1 DivIVA domain-containing protein [Prauserella flava]MCR3736984.1 DivIVA domain-containing protein [Prauserella salsuginis]